jgi:hypothetical protein
MRFLKAFTVKGLIFITFFTIGLAFSGVAQGPGGEDDLNNPDQNPVPIDGGLSLALAAGAGYLVKRRHDAKKKKAEQDKQILP